MNESERIIFKTVSGVRMGGFVSMGCAHGCAWVSPSGISFSFILKYCFSLSQRIIHIYTMHFDHISIHIFPSTSLVPHSTISPPNFMSLLKKINPNVFFQCCPCAPGCGAIHWSMSNYQWPHSKENSPCLTNHQYTNSFSDKGRDLVSRFPYMWEFLLSSSSFQTIFHEFGVH